MASDYYLAPVMTWQSLMDMGSELEYAAQAGHREIHVDPMKLAHMLMWAAKRIEELEARGEVLPD